MAQLLPLQLRNFVKRLYAITSTVILFSAYCLFKIGYQLMQKRGGDGKPKRILDPDLTYLMDLEKELPRFIDLCYPEYVKAGIADSRSNLSFE